VLASLAALDPGVRVETEGDGWLAVRAGDGVPVRLRHTPYPLVGAGETMDGLAVASPADLGLRMLEAMAGGSGSRRDLVELYLLCRELPLAELLDGAGESFGNAAGELRRQALQALDCLAGQPATADPDLPRLAIEVGWQEVEAWVEREVRTTGRRRWPPTS
jgi:hypothetical protein